MKGNYYSISLIFNVATIAIILAAVSLLPMGVLARSHGLEPGGYGIAVEIVDGDTLILDDGRQVRLVGLQAPKLPLGRPNFKPWPLGEEAKSVLRELTLGKRLSLSYGGRKTDRYGRHLAHLHDDDGNWIQGAMLRRGYARVYSFPDNRRWVDRMLEREREARAARRGIWAHQFYRVRHVSELRRDGKTFQIAEGRILDVATVKGRTYLNFGPDWRTDFTITVQARDRRRFAKSKMDLQLLNGRLVRVRGWLRWRNGPMIEATHPEQIEILE